MSNAPMMHWHEGLFLLPHHLQGMQRDFVDRVRSERLRSRPYPFGVVEMQLFAEGLSEYKIKFDKLHVVMPSGVEVITGPGGNCDLGIREFRHKFAIMSSGMTVSLAVPIWQPGRSNTIGLPSDPAFGTIGTDASRVDRIYTVHQEDIADENTGRDEKSVLTRNINARLVIEGENIDNLETLPLIRIEASSNEDGVVLPREDPTFSPACYSIGGSAKMYRLLRDLAAAALTHRQELASKLGGQGMGWSPSTLNSTQMLAVLRLRTLNHYSGMLQQLVAASGVSPFEVYLRLREFLGELAALAPDRDAFETAAYDHLRPGPIFRELDKRIRPLLREPTQGTFKEFKFNLEGASLVSSPIELIDFENGIDFMLGIQSKADANELTRLVIDSQRFNLLPSTYRGSAENQVKVPGIKLEREFADIPTALRQRPGLNYFRLNTSASDQMWKNARRDKKLCLVWGQGERFSYESVSLFITMAESQQPSQGSGKPGTPSTQTASR